MPKASGPVTATSSATTTAVPGTSSASASEVPAQGAETPQELKRQLDELKQEVQAMREKKVSTESLLNELNIYCATHHDATFAPNHAMALVDNLVSVARREGHERAEEFEAFAEELVTEKSKPFFGPLVRRLFGASVKAQAASKVSAFIKSWKAVKDVGSKSVSASVKTRYPGPSKDRSVKGHWGKLGKNQCASVWHRATGPGTVPTTLRVKSKTLCSRRWTGTTWNFVWELCSKKKPVSRRVVSVVRDM
ncbi:PREDICTED: uncharacterized protein LOC109481559 [Branchiostoma belcheri]|uniref:Uncharacterized protein LOC109481559 n=1 Tax=Branchiostoma belcheri TaxID=7741 RepID=A0A6P5A077_BRABE|nr:PREDICTED: uncharacterized protein LOC109481559 [Branchiostoma belcheri]